MSARPPTSVVGSSAGRPGTSDGREENRGLRISELGYEEGKAILMGDTEAANRPAGAPRPGDAAAPSSSTPPASTRRVVGNASTFNAPGGQREVRRGSGAGRRPPTRSMAVAGQAGRIGGLFGAGRATFQMEFGSTFNESAHWPTADGSRWRTGPAPWWPRWPPPRRRASSCWSRSSCSAGGRGFIVRPRRGRGVHQADGGEGPCGAGPTAPVESPTPPRGGGSRGPEEGSQTLVDQGAQTWSTGLPAGTSPRCWRTSRRPAPPSSSSAASGGPGFRRRGYGAGRDERRSSRVIQTTAELAKRHRRAEPPGAAGHRRPEVTRPTGTEVTAWHVDAEQAKKHFQPRRRRRTGTSPR